MSKGKHTSFGGGHCRPRPSSSSCTPRETDEFNHGPPPLRSTQHTPLSLSRHTSPTHSSFPSPPTHAQHDAAGLEMEGTARAAAARPVVAARIIKETQPPVVGHRLRHWDRVYVWHHVRTLPSIHGRPALQHSVRFGSHGPSSTTPPATTPHALPPHIRHNNTTTAASFRYGSFSCAG